MGRFDLPEVAMSVVPTLSRAQQAQIRAHLRTLRGSLTQARDSLMHFKSDRLDRDKLEPAARRIDDLMNLFAGNVSDSAQSLLWVVEIQRGVKEVTNSKAATALKVAQEDIAALLGVMVTDGKSAAAIP